MLAAFLVVPRRELATRIAMGVLLVTCAGVPPVVAPGLMVFDAQKKFVLEHPARATDKGVEANSCAVLDGGSLFALLDGTLNCRCRPLPSSAAPKTATAFPRSPGSFNRRRAGEIIVAEHARANRQ